jgi:Transposase IS66 family
MTNSSYKGLFERGDVEVGCMARARREFHELRENHCSQIATEAPVFFGVLYKVKARAGEEELGMGRKSSTVRRNSRDHERHWI